MRMKGVYCMYSSSHVYLPFPFNLFHLLIIVKHSLKSSQG